MCWFLRRLFWFFAMTVVVSAQSQETAEVSALRVAADGGNLSAMRELGDHLYRGDRIAVDQAKAVEWYTRAASGGDTLAMTRLAYYLSHVKKDYAGALEWYRKAADRGEALAMNNLGQMYQQGKGVDGIMPRRCSGTARRWTSGCRRRIPISGFFMPADWGFRAMMPGAGMVSWRGRSAGEVGAMYNMGRFYDTGRAVPKDEAAALEWYLRGANAGDRDSMYQAGMHFRDGRGADAIAEAAAIWFRKGAELGDPNAMLELGRSYWKGLGVPPDPAEAFRWYRKSAELGNLQAMYDVAMAYESGVGPRRMITRPLHGCGCRQSVVLHGR